MSTIGGPTFKIHIYGPNSGVTQNSLETILKFEFNFYVHKYIKNTKSSANLLTLMILTFLMNVWFIWITFSNGFGKLTKSTQWLSQ